MDAGAAELAAASFKAALELQPDLAAAHVNLALLLEDQACPAEAERHYRQALGLEPGSVRTCLNFGALLQAQKRLDEAEDLYRQALEQDPGSPALWSNLGCLQAGRKQDDQAEQSLRIALGLDPSHCGARFNLSYVLLRQGRFAEGWQCFEARDWYAPFEQGLDCPRWQGEHLAGRKLLIVPEAGHGDMLQFCRYVALLKAEGPAHITLLCHPGLKRLFAGLADAVCCGDGDWPAVAPDFWVPLLSLPRYFKTGLASIPASLPYLAPDPLLVKEWAGLLDVAPGNLRVGLAWRGNPRFENDDERSLASLAQLAPLAQISGISYFSLQKEAAQPLEGLELIDLAPRLTDFADTAAAIANLDLVISVDTAVAHLAGALAKPCWLLLPDYKTDWRWLSGRADSPWYPGVMRLFRQPAGGGWAAVVAEVCAALILSRPRT